MLTGHSDDDVATVSDDRDYDYCSIDYDIHDCDDYT